VLPVSAVAHNLMLYIFSATYYIDCFLFCLFLTPSSADGNMAWLMWQDGAKRNATWGETCYRSDCNDLL